MKWPKLPETEDFVYDANTDVMKSDLAQSDPGHKTPGTEDSDHKNTRFDATLKPGPA